MKNPRVEKLKAKFKLPTLQWSKKDKARKEKKKDRHNNSWNCGQDRKTQKSSNLASGVNALETRELGKK